MVLDSKHKSLWMLSQQQPTPQPIFCSEIYGEKTLNYHHLDPISLPIPDFNVIYVTF